jgi:hypothetical protein
MEALTKGLDDMTDVCAHIVQTFQQRLDERNFDLIEEGVW